MRALPISATAHHLLESNLEVIDAAAKDSEKRKQECGGKRTEPGFNSNTCDLLNKVRETLPIILNYFASRFL